MLCGTAITYPTPCVRQRLASICSAHNFPIPYGSCGAQIIASMNGGLSLPYRAIDEQWTIRSTRLAIAAENTETEAPTIFWVTTWGEKTESPSYAVAAQ